MPYDIVIYLITLNDIFPVSVDFVIPQRGESLVAAYHKWKDWAEPKGTYDGFRSFLLANPEKLRDFSVVKP